MATSPYRGHLTFLTLSFLVHTEKAKAPHNDHANNATKRSRPGVKARCEVERAVRNVTNWTTCAFSAKRAASVKKNFHSKG